MYPTIISEIDFAGIYMVFIFGLISLGGITSGELRHARVAPFRETTIAPMLPANTCGPHPAKTRYEPGSPPRKTLSSACTNNAAFNDQKIEIVREFWETL
jgi:hypothetical protein